METQKLNYVEVPELGIRITDKQQFNGRTYPEILKEVSEEQIATYEILQKLRNIAFESGWKKYPFMKKFYVFFPNPDEVSKSNGYFSRLYADSGWANLYSERDPVVGYADRGVFLYCPIANKSRKQ